MARDYELGIIINPDLGDEQARATVERVTQFVTTNGGQLVRVNAQGRRHLAYPIEHHRDGLYFWFDLILPPESIAGLERSIGVNEDIIRHLVKLRDPRVIQQVRQREAEADAQAAAQAAARAAHEAEAAARVPATVEAAVEAAETAETAEETTAEASEGVGGAEAGDEEGESEAVATGAEEEA
jgi:small subunit ribosomal protein S6